MMEEIVTYSKSDAKEEYSVVDLSQISLRPISLSDIDDVMVWTSDAKVAKYCTWEPYTNKEKGIDFIQNIASKSLWFRAICLRDRAIGCTEFQACSERCRDKSAQLGYSLSSMYWGKGIATMVVKQVVDAAFKEFPYLERLEARVDVENVASQRVLEKAGFQREGVLRKYLFIKGKSIDIVMFSILSSEVII